MKIRKVLVVYKRSVFEKSFQGRSFLKKKHSSVIDAHLKKTFLAHQEHYQSLEKVCAVLKELGLPWQTAERKDKIDFKPFDAVITVGGDGTFMEVSHQIKDKLILGVNSATHYSVGRYCCSDAEHLKDVLKDVIRGRSKVQNFQRLQLLLDGKTAADCVLNDFLIAHQNPAMMSRYDLQIGAKKEEQKSSGVWVSSPSGSSGAIKSAGGRVIAADRRAIVYWPRELYRGFKRRYELQGGVLPPGKTIRMTSMMRDGMIYGDGGLVTVPFPYGSIAEIKLSRYPVKTVQRVL